MTGGGLAEVAVDERHQRQGKGYFVGTRAGCALNTANGKPIPVRCVELAKEVNLMICSCPHHAHLNWRFLNAQSRKGRIHRLSVVLTVAGALTAGLYAQRGGQNAAPQAAGPRPSTAPPLVPVRLDVDGNFRIAPPYAPDPAFSEKPNVPKGRVIRFTMNSAESKIFPTAPVGGARGARGRRRCDGRTAAASDFPASGRRLHSGRVRSEHANTVHRRAGRADVHQWIAANPVIR